MMTRLKELRKKSGLNQEELASALNVKRNTIGMWENARRDPSLETIKRMADYFGVTTDYLLGHDTGAPAFVTPDEESLLTKYRGLAPALKGYVQAIISTIPSFGGGQLAAAR